ncbi:uncharacterized protein LOC130933016 isoform X1 [Arachis stenosperma]|uniref:uncharacterized protein LOC130933016 isoform X1 n=1 Tax=Arachis stenosperma TaxID=217475 RepID=UPI0025AD7FB8|nr:uncharacterized protein LOC130933016 isoform X1 [Arachis stenosperma]
MEIGEVLVRASSSSIPLHHRNPVPSHFHVHLPKASSFPLSSENRIFILGIGFVAQSLALKLQNHGWVVSGTCTSHVKKKKLEGMGFQVCLFDANYPQPSMRSLLKDCTHLLVSIPPVAGIGDPMLQHEELLRSSLVDGNLQWLCYLSSTSVYGDCGGELVDEDYPTNPKSESAKLRLASEEGWSNLAHHLGFSSQVFRLGGIYGPGRSAINTILKQEPLSEGQKMRKYRKYTSRVHVDDICQALMSAIYTTPPRLVLSVINFLNYAKFCKILWHFTCREVYNIVDDDPAPREEVFEYARKLVLKKWPGLNLEHLELEESSGAKTRNQWGEKRVSNTRMKKELGVQLLYPDYKSGLQSIIDQIENPFSNVVDH